MLPETKMALLEYEKQIFLDSFQDDGLLIMARYLSIQFSIYIISFLII